MTLQIEINERRSAELLAILASSTESTLTGRRDEVAEHDRFVVVELSALEQREVLNFVALKGRFKPFSGLPYNDWLVTQPRVDFWKIASSWSIFWQSVWLSQYSGPALENWPYLVEHPIPTPPLVSFLELSDGYIQWDWQIDLLFCLSGFEKETVQTLLRRWNGLSPDVWERSKNQLLPDGTPLINVLKNHARPGGWQAVGRVPVYQAKRLLLAWATQKH